MQNGRTVPDSSNSLQTNEYLTANKQEGFTVEFIGEDVDRLKENSLTFKNDMTSMPTIGKDQVVYHIREYAKTDFSNYLTGYYNNKETLYGKIFNPDFYLTKNEQTEKTPKYSRLFNMTTATLSDVAVTTPNVNAKKFENGEIKLKDTYNVFNRSSIVDVNYTKGTEINGETFPVYYIDKDGNKVGKPANLAQGGDYVENYITISNRPNASSVVKNMKINFNTNEIGKIVSWEIVENNTGKAITAISNNQNVNENETIRNNRLIINADEIGIGQSIKIKVTTQFVNDNNKLNIEDLDGIFDIYLYADKLHNTNNIKFDADKYFIRNDVRDSLGYYYYKPSFSEVFEGESNFGKYYYNQFTTKESNLNDVTSIEENYEVNKNFKSIREYEVQNHQVFRIKNIAKMYNTENPEITYTFDREVNENKNIYHRTNDDATLTISKITNKTGRFIDELVVTVDLKDEQDLKGFRLTENVIPTYPDDEINHRDAKVEYFVDNEWKTNTSDYANVSKIRVTYYDITKDELEIPNLLIHGKGRWQDVRTDKEHVLMSDFYLSKDRVDVDHNYIDDKNDHFNLTSFAKTTKDVLRGKAKVLVQSQVFENEEVANQEYDSNKPQKLGYRPNEILWNKIHVENIKSQQYDETDGPLFEPVIFVRVPEYFKNYDNINNFKVQKTLIDGNVVELINGVDYTIEKEETTAKDFGGDQIISQKFDKNSSAIYGGRAFSDIKVEKTYESKFMVYKLKFKETLDVTEKYDVVYSGQVRTNGLPMTYFQKENKIYNAYFPKLMEYYHTTNKKVKPNVLYTHKDGHPYIVASADPQTYIDLDLSEKYRRHTSFEELFINNKQNMMDLDNLYLDAGVSGTLGTEEEAWEYLNHSEPYIPGSTKSDDFVRDNGINNILDDDDINSGNESSHQKTYFNISTNNKGNQSWNNIYYAKDFNHYYSRDFYKLLLSDRYANVNLNENGNIVWASTKTRLQKAWLLGSTDIQPVVKSEDPKGNYSYIYGFGERLQETRQMRSSTGESIDGFDNSSTIGNERTLLLDNRLTALEYNQRATHNLMAVNYGDWHLNGVVMTYVLPNGFKPDLTKGFSAKVLKTEARGTYEGFSEDITNDVTMEVIQTPSDSQVYKALKTSVSPDLNNEEPEYYNNEGTYVLKFTVNHRLNKWFNSRDEHEYKILINFESIVTENTANERWNDELLVTPIKDNDSLYYQVLDFDYKNGTATLRETEPFMDYMLNDGYKNYAIGTSVNTPYVNGFNIQNKKYENNGTNGILLNDDEHNRNKDIENYNIAAVSGTSVVMKKPAINTWVTLNNSKDGKFKANDYTTYYINKVGEETKVNVHIQNKFNLDSYLSNFSPTVVANMTSILHYNENGVAKTNWDYGDGDVIRVNNRFRYNSGTIGGNQGDYILPVINIVLPTSLYPTTIDGKAVTKDGDNIVSWKLYDKDGNELINEQNKYNTKVKVLNIQKENSTETEKKYLVQIYAKDSVLGNENAEARIKYNDEYIFSVNAISYDSTQVEEANGKEFLSPISVFATSKMDGFKFVTDDDVIDLMNKRKELSEKENDSEIFKTDDRNFFEKEKEVLGDMFRIGGTWHDYWYHHENDNPKIEPHETMYKSKYTIDYMKWNILANKYEKIVKEFEGGNLLKLDEQGNYGKTYKLVEYNHRYKETDTFNLENSGKYNLLISNYDFSTNGKTEESGVFTQFNPRLTYPLLKLDLYVSDNLDEISNDQENFEYGNKVYLSSKIKIEKENNTEYGQRGDMIYRTLEETIAIPYSLVYSDKKEFYISFYQNGNLVTKNEQELKDLGWKIEEVRNTFEQDPSDNRKQYNIITYKILIPEKDFDTTNEETIMNSFVNGHPMGYLKNGDEIYFRIGTRVGNILEENFKSNKEDTFFEKENSVGMLTSYLIKANWMKPLNYNIVYHNRTNEDGSTWFKDGISIPDVNKNGNVDDVYSKSASREIQIKKPNANVRIDTGRPRIRVNNKDAEKALLDDPYIKSIQTMDLFITNAENKTNVNEFILNVDVPRYSTQYRSTRYADKSDTEMNSTIHSIRTGKWKFNNEYQNEISDYHVVLKARVSNNITNDFRGTIASNSNLDEYITIGNEDGYALDENAEVEIPTQYENKITNIDFVIKRKDNSSLASDSNLRKENPVYKGLTLDVDAVDDIDQAEYLKERRKSYILSLKYLKNHQTNIDLSDNGTSLMTEEEITKLLEKMNSNKTETIENVLTEEEINELLFRTNFTKEQLNYIADSIVLSDDEINYIQSTLGVQNINDVDPDQNNLKELSNSIKENSPKINVSQEILAETHTRKHLNYFATIWAKYDDNKFGKISDTNRTGFYVNPQLPYLSINIFGKYFSLTNENDRSYYKWIDDLTINPDFSTTLKYDLSLDNIGNEALKKKFGMEELADNATNPEISVVLPYFETLNQTDFKEIDYNTEYKNSVIDNKFEKEGNINHEKPIWTWYVVDKTTGKVVDGYKDRFSVSTKFGYKSVDLSTYKRKIINWKFNGVLRPNETIHVEFLLPLNIQDLGLVSSTLMNIKDYAYKKGNFLPFIDSTDSNGSSSSLEIDTRDINFDGNKNDMTLTRTGMSVLFLANTSLQKTKKASTEIENNTKETRPAAMPENTDVEFNVSVQNPGMTDGNFKRPMIFDILPYEDDKDIININSDDNSERNRGSKWKPYLNLNSFTVKEYSMNNVAGQDLDKDKYRIYIGPVKEINGKYQIYGNIPTISERRTNSWYRNTYLNDYAKKNKYFVSLDKVLNARNKYQDDEWNQFVRGIKMFMVDFNVDNINARHRYEVTYKMHSPVNTPVHYGNFIGKDYEILNKASKYTIWNTQAVSIEEANPTESNKAGAYSYVPEETGYIGSYVWEDFNQNGIEDDAVYEERNDGRKILKSYNTDTDFDGENNDPGINGVYVELLNENGLNVNQRHEAVKYLESEEKYVLVDNVTGEYLYDQFGEHLYTELKPKTEYTTFDYYGNKGYYLFSNLTPNKYKLRFTFDEKSEYVMTSLERNGVQFNVVSRNNGKLIVESDVINVNAFGNNNDIESIKKYNKNAEFNIGVSRPYIYAGYAFAETNTQAKPANGLMENDEEKLSNVKVSVRYAENPNEIVKDADGFEAVTRTNENGYFKFRLNPNHKYVLKAEKEDYVASPITVNNNPTARKDDNDLVNTENGYMTRPFTIERPTNNAGKVLFNEDNQGYLTNDSLGLGFTSIQKGSIGNLIWNDSNYNGIYDFTEELGIPNVELTLKTYVYDGTNWSAYLDSSGNEVTRTIRTNETGSYVFADLQSTELKDGKYYLLGYKISAVHPTINGRMSMVSKYNKGNISDNNDYEVNKDQMSPNEIGDYIVTLRKANENELNGGVQNASNLVTNNGKTYLFGYEIGFNQQIDNVDGAFTEDEVSKIKGKVFLDKNHNNVYDENEDLKNIDVVLERYVQNNNSWTLDSTMTTKTNNNGDYIFDNLPSHTEKTNGTYKLYSYKVKLNKNIYEKYTEVKLNSGNNPDIDSDLLTDGSLYLTNDFIIFAKDANDTDSYYEVDFNNKKYDVIKNNPDEIRYAGLQELEYSTIRGTVFADDNYDGISDNDKKLGNVNVSLIPYYYDNEWKELDNSNNIIKPELLKTKTFNGQNTYEVKVKGETTKTLNVNTGDYVFKNLPTFIRKNNNKYLLGYKIVVDYANLNENSDINNLTNVTRLISKYHVNGENMTNDNDVSPMTRVVNNEIIPVGVENNDDNSPYTVTINDKTYNITNRTDVENKDYGTTNVLGNIFVKTFEDVDYVGSNTKNRLIGNVKVELKSYYYDNGNFIEYESKIKTSNGEAKFNNLPTYFVINGERKLAGYKLFVNDFDKTNYAITKRNVNGNENDSNLRDDNLSLNDDNDYIILASIYNRTDENPYKVTVNGIEYDIANAIGTVRNYNAGFKRFENSFVKGNVFDDNNYNGVFNKNDENLTKENATINTNVYYLKDNKFVFEKSIITNVVNGVIDIKNLPTFIEKDGNKYLAGYKFDITTDSNNVGYTKHIYETNLLNNMAVVRNAKTADIMSPQADFKENDVNGYVIVAGLAVENSPNANIRGKYDIATINKNIEITVGLKKFNKTEITGDMFDDADYNGIKLNDKLLSGKIVTSNEYYFDDVDNTWKQINNTKLNSQITNGKFSMINDTYFIKNNKRYLKGVKPRLQELPNGYFPTKYQIGLDKTIDSDLIKNNLYITEDYIPMGKPVTDTQYRQYLRTVNGVTYDLLENNDSSRDLGVTKSTQGIIKGYVFDDENYNGLKDENENGKIVTIQANSYMVVNGQLIENDTQEFTSNEDGYYEMNVNTHAIDSDGNIRLLVYKLNLKEYPENYTATKYHVVGNGNSSNLLLNKEIVKENENLYVPASIDTINSNDKYTIDFKNTKYDIVKGRIIDNVDIGIISYKKGSISGTIFEDDNYNGIHEETEKKEISGNVTLKQYYYNNTEWVETNFTQTINKQEFKFENLPTFVEVENEKYLAGYKLFVENPNNNEYAITKYMTNNGDNDSKLLTSNEITYGNEVDGMIILAGKKTDKSNEIKYKNYDIVENVNIKNYDSGFVKFENNGKISGVIFNDINYNGKNDDNLFYKGITIVLEQYRTDKTFVGDIKETTTDVNGKYTFDKVPGFIIEEGNKIPVVYKVKVKELDPYTTVSKYGIDSELRYDNLSFMKDDEYYIPSTEINESKNPNYEFDFNGKKYDFVKNESTITKNGGLKDYEKASISGMIFDDVNFDGIKDQNEKAISNHTITVKQFAKIDGNWISTDEVFTGKTNENGIFEIENIPTFVLKDNNKYLAGYEVYDNSVDENTHAVTIYGTDSFLKTNSHIIQKPNDYEGKIVLAKLVNDLTGLNEVYDNQFDIVESTNKSNYNGGIKDYEKGTIKGTIFEDKNYDGLMNDNTFVKNIKVQLLAYKLPIDENSFIGIEKEVTTNDNGEFTFDELDTFKVIDGVRIPVVYQVKVKEIPNDKAVTKYRVNAENTRSNLVKNTLKLNEENEYFVISDNSSNVNKADYNFDFNGKTYNYVKAIEIADVNGGLKTFENNGIISGKIWNDEDYNGVMNNEENGIENISVSVEQYKLVDGHFELYNGNYQNTNTDKNGEYHFNKLETFITENDVRIPVSYKVKVNKIPEDYAITKYNVASTIYRNSDLRTNLYLNRDDEYIIVADKYNSQSNADYSFAYEGKTYDIVKSTSVDEFDGGLVEFKADGEIRGQIFEDINYDGIMNDNSYIKGIVVEAEQYKYINNNFVKVDIVANGTSDDNGNFVINNLPTFIVEDGTRIPVAYKIKVKNIPDNFAVTKYQVAIQNNEKNSDLRVSDLYMNKDNEYIFVTDKADAIRNETYEFTYNNTVYDIVKPTYSDNHNAGLKIYEQNGKIEGTVFNDKDYNGLMNEEDRISNQTVILETYKLVNGKFIKTNEKQNANTDENGNFKFENLPTFIIENENKVPVSYKLRLKDMKQGYAVTKYRVPSNEFRNSDLKYDSLYLNENDEFIIVSGNADEIGNVRYEFEYDGQKYDLTKAVTKKDYDAGIVEYSNGETIEGQIFNDKNYDGLMNDNTKEKVSNISISLNQYILVNGKWKFNKIVESTNTDKDGKFKFENVKSYIVKVSDSNITSNSNIYNERGNEERIPVAYRLHVNKLPENTTVTKYRINKKVVSNSNLNEVNSDLVFETHDLNETNEFIILSKNENTGNIPYSFTYENKNYDYIKTEKPRNYYGGIKEYENGSIEGRLWEDENYDGLQNNNEPYIEGKKVTLKQYYLDGSNWIFVKDFETTTDKDGKYQFTKLISHIDGKLTGYKVFVENFDENQYAITKYFVNNGKDDSSLMKVASASEIKKPNQYKDMIIISKEKTKEEQNTNLFKEIINKLFNIVEAIEIKNYDGGVSKFENNGSIEGKIWLDNDRDSIKSTDETEGISDVQIKLEQYAFINNKFEFIRDYETIITDDSGEFKFNNLPLFRINKDGKKEALGYKIKVIDINGSYGISEFKDDNQLNEDTMYIGDIIIPSNENNINNGLYEFEYNGIQYNFVKGVKREGYFGGLYRNNADKPYVDINKKPNNPNQNNNSNNNVNEDGNNNGNNNNINHNNNTIFGKIFLDENGDGLMNNNEKGIIDIPVIVEKYNKDGKFIEIINETKTNNLGLYEIKNLNEEYLYRIKIKTILKPTKYNVVGEENSLLNENYYIGNNFISIKNNVTIKMNGGLVDQKELKIGKIILPKTGDMMNVYTYIIFIISIAGIVFVLTKKKRRG